MTSAKLFLLGMERELLWVDTNYYRYVARDGSPSSNLEGGLLRLSFVSQESDEVFWHNMVKKVDKETERMEKGEIHFYSKGNEDSAIRKYKFNDAYLIEFSEIFHSWGTENMQIILTISPAIQNYGYSQDFVKHWQVSSLPTQPTYYQPKQETEDRIIYINGHFYNKDGTFEGKINEPDFEGSVEDVYVCDGKGEIKYLFKNTKKLDITHENFCYIAGVIKAEDSSTFESAAATTQATFNAVKFEKGEGLNMQEQSKYAAKILSTGYSTATSKKMLDDSENGNDFRNTRRALIHVVQGNRDYSEGAILWDGIDFADRGINHPKAREGGGISISKDLWLKFINNCTYKPDKKGILRLSRGKGEKDKTKEEALKTIPFLDEQMPNLNDNLSYIFDFGENNDTIWNTSKKYGERKNIDYYETLGTIKYNKGRTLNKATVVYGGHIFWRPFKEHPNNKGYYWKGMINFI